MTATTIDTPNGVTEINGDVVEMEFAHTMRGQLASGKRAAYVLAGDATLTIRSSKTGQRFTYRVSKSDDKGDGRAPVHFVKVMNGSDNEGDYVYLGTIFADGKFRVTRKSRVTADAPSAVAFAYFSTHMEDARIDVWHEGTCGRCGRKLTVPESIESGLGPVCAKNVAGAIDPEPAEPKPAQVAPVPATMRAATLYTPATATTDRFTALYTAATPAPAPSAVRGPASGWTF